MAAATTTAILSAQQEQQLQLLQKLLNGPAMAPPPGIKPNFVNPPNLEKEFYIDLILCLTISVLAVCMRVWTKARVMRKFQIEDCKSLPPAHALCFLPPFLSLSYPALSPPLPTKLCVFVYCKMKNCGRLI